MFHQLHEDEYESVRSLYRDLSYNLVVDSVIDGNTPAWVFVDDKNNPQSALMWNKYSPLLLAGFDGNDQFNTALGDQLTQRVFPDAQSRYIPEMILYYDSDAWERRVGAILQGRKLVKKSRRYYAFTSVKTGWRAQTPLAGELRRIDEALLENDDLENIDQVRGWVRSFWRSYQDFVDTGMGYCLAQDKTIMSWCLSAYVSGTDYELGLFAVPEHRRQGYATHVANACVEYCSAHGLTPHWHCGNDNLGSIAVAEKVGFANPTFYSVFQFELG